MTINFYASNHRLGDGRISEGEEWESTEEIRTRAVALAGVWGCEWVNVYESGDPEMLMQVNASGL